MTINRKFLHGLEKSSLIFIPEEKKRIILERFGTEPEPYVWSDQDIEVQIPSFLGCGEFVKSMQWNGARIHCLPGCHPNGEH